MITPIKISIITACFNSELTIRDAITSLKCQSWPYIEHIIIDGKSKDATVVIARETLGDGDLLVSEKDGGIFDALNKGLNLASGDVIGFLNSDDLFADNKVLEKVAGCFNDPEVGAVYGDLKYVNASNTDKVIRYWRSGKFSRAKLKMGWMPAHPTFFMRRGFYQELGGFDASYRIAGDYDALLRYLNNDRLNTVYFPEVLVKMRVGGASNGSLKSIVRKSKEDVLAMMRHNINPFVALPYKNLSKLPQFFSAG